MKNEHVGIFFMGCAAEMCGYLIISVLALVDFFFKINKTLALTKSRSETYFYLMCFFLLYFNGLFCVMLKM